MYLFPKVRKETIAKPTVAQADIDVKIENQM